MKPENKALTILNGGNAFILKIETFLIAAITIGLVGVIFIEVICRYLFYISTAWTEELARYLFIWLTYIGSSYALNQGSHIEIDICKQAIEKTRLFKNKRFGLRVLEIASITSTMVFLVIFSKLFWDFMMQFWTSAQTSPTMHIPMGYIYLPVFIGCVLSIYHGIYLLVSCLRTRTAA
ncbi:MAG: TRAP transporter small permease [Clostridia bacterium]|nr:TRAP transporter small permease [Clostridia bacterium]